jgi:hypothetical protein
MDDYSEFEEMSEEYFNHMMEYYTRIGAIEVTGMTEDGEVMYAITDLAEEVAPELWKMHHDAIDETLVDLYKKGLVEVEYDEDLNANMKLSEEGTKLMESYGFYKMDEE